MPRLVVLWCLILAFMTMVGCAGAQRSSAADLPGLAHEWEAASLDADREQALRRLLLAFALAQPATDWRQQPAESLLETLTMEMVFGRHVYEMGASDLGRAWKIGNIWMLEGVTISGRELVSDSDPGAVPQLQQFQLRQDMVVHISPEGPLLLTQSEMIETLGPAEVMPVP